VGNFGEKNVQWGGRVMGCLTRERRNPVESGPNSPRPEGGKVGSKQDTFVDQR